jgi:hypothetical protein
VLHWKTISDDEARRSIEKKEFPESILFSKDNVAVILTQGWCPQWGALKHDLEAIASSAKPDIDAYVFIYDRSPLFADFLSFKESVLGNDRIPYVRYYRKGTYQTDSNYVGAEEFLKHFI